MRRLLKSENLLSKKLLQNKVILLNKIIEPGFIHKPINRESNPKEYFVANVLTKLYSLNVSMENSLLANDVLLSIYIHRYIYELYIKTLYIFSGSSEEEILSRLNVFFDDDKWKIAEILEKIKDSLLPSDFQVEHKEKYKSICRFVHPNYESLKLHLNRSDDQQFEFLVPNIKLAIWYSIAMVKVFSDAKCLDFDKKINQTLLMSLQKEH